MGTKQTVKTRDFRKLMKFWGLTHVRTKGSHESWSKAGMTRPAILQSNKKEVPRHILSTNLKSIGKTMDDLLNDLEKI